MDSFIWHAGFIAVVYSLLRIALAVYHVCKVYIFPTYPDFSKYGKWAVVTGATDGIGKAIALQLASRGQNIILIARNPQKLKNTANEIASNHGVKAKCLKFDFSDDESIYDEMKESLKGYDIGVLVNNVGIVPLQIRFLALVNHFPKFLRDATRVNMVSVYKMTEIILPGMVQRRRGLIINLSSSVAVRHMFTVYGATKAFVDYFSQALSYEYTDKGITVQVMKEFVKQKRAVMQYFCGKYGFSWALGTMGFRHRKLNCHESPIYLSRTVGIEPTVLDRYPTQRAPCALLQSCLPGYVHTNMNKDFHFENMFTLTAESYARSLLGTADKERKTYGCWQHDFQAWLLSLIPGQLFHWMLEKAKTKIEETRVKKSS